MVKQRIGIVFGGQTTEHEVSLQSAKNILISIDKTKYEVVLLGLDKQGQWYLNEPSDFLLNAENSMTISFNNSGKSILLALGRTAHNLMINKNVYSLSQIDVIFPIIHGSLGEDGSLQGLLKMANIPYVGSNVLSSAISMDKDITKRLLSSAGLKVAPWFCFNKKQNTFVDTQAVIDTLGLPLFIKPANQGSSIGVSKVTNISEFNAALDLAFTFGNKILIEQCIKGREIECAVLGNTTPKASPCGEIILQKDLFYSYDTKYIKKNCVKLIVPASISYKDSEAIRSTAINAFQVLECLGMARVDVFLTESGEIIINEVNTLPGFTSISMYPKLWQTAGLSCSNLITRLIELAQEHYDDNNQFKMSHNTY